MTDKKIKRKKKSTGRPKVNKTITCISLSKTAKDMLLKLCEETGLPQSQLVELLIRKNYKDKADIVMNLL